MTDANVSEKAYDYVYGLKQTHQDTKLAELATKASNWAKNTGNNVSAVSSTAVAEAPVTPTSLLLRTSRLATTW